MAKEVVLESYIYVAVEDSKEQDVEKVIQEAKEKAMKVLEDAGLDCQFFSEELREI